MGRGVLGVPTDSAEFQKRNANLGHVGLCMGWHMSGMVLELTWVEGRVH